MGPTASSERYDEAEEDDYDSTYQRSAPNPRGRRVAPAAQPFDELTPPPGVVKNSSDNRPVIAAPLAVASPGVAALMSKRQRKAMLYCRKRTSCRVLRRHCYAQEYDAPGAEADDWREDANVAGTGGEARRGATALRRFRFSHDKGYVCAEMAYHYGATFRETDDRGFALYTPKKEVMVAYIDRQRLALGLRSVVVDYEGSAAALDPALQDDDVDDWHDLTAPPPPVMDVKKKGWKLVQYTVKATHGSEAMTIITRKPFSFHIAAVKALIYCRRWLRHTRKRVFIKKLALIVRTATAVQTLQHFLFYWQVASKARQHRHFSLKFGALNGFILTRDVKVPT